MRLPFRDNPASRLPVLPSLTRTQVEALEARWPVRLIEPGESLEAYIRYCGAADVVQALKAACIEVSKEPITEEEWDEEAERRAIEQMNTPR